MQFLDYVPYISLLLFICFNLKVQTTYGISDVNQEEILLLRATGDPIPGRRVLWSGDGPDFDSEPFRQEANEDLHDVPEVAPTSLPCDDPNSVPQAIHMEYSSSIVENGKFSVITHISQKSITIFFPLLLLLRTKICCGEV